MKTALLAAAALALVACSASTPDAETSEAADTVADDALTSVPVTINVPTELTEMRCRILMGSWISFRFQFHDFLAYAADDLGTCNEKLATLRATPIQHGIFVRERRGDLTVFTLQLGGFLFTSRNPTDFEGLVVTQKSAVVATFTNPRCELSKGFSTLRADFDGVTYEEQLDFDACSAAKAEIVRSSHSGVLTVSVYEAHTWRELVLDDGKRVFTADVPVHE